MPVHRQALFVSSKKMPFYSRVITKALLIILCGCSNQNGPESQWNLMGGPYWKHGETIAYNGYWIEAYKDTTDGSFLLLLVNEDEGQAISDSLRIGTLPDTVFFDYGTVEYNLQQDRSLVALYKRDDSLFHSEVLKAWRANVTTGRFEAFSTEGVRVPSR